MSSWNARRWIVVVLCVALVTVASGALLLARDQWRKSSTWAGADDTPRVVVRLPVLSPEPTFSPSPEALPPLPPLFVARASPLRIEGDLRGKSAELSFSYSDVVDPEALVVLTYSAEFGQWVPVDGVLDPDRRRVTVRTAHFSDWVIAETDPDAYRALIKGNKELMSGFTGTLLTALYGELAVPDCSPDRLLLPARVRFAGGVGSPAQLCEEVLADGTYRLRLINTSDLPVSVTIPDGFEVEKARADVIKDFRDSMRELGGAGKALLPPRGGLALRFDAQDLPSPGLEFRGEVDWAAAMRELAYSAIVSVVGDLDEFEKTPEALGKALGVISAQAELAECLSTISTNIRDKVLRPGTRGRDVLGAVSDSMSDCLSSMVGAALAVWEAAASGSRGFVRDSYDRFKFLGKRLTAVLDIKDYMTFARQELSVLLALPASREGVDIGMTVRPWRVMTLDEARRLPEACSEPGDDDFLPAGAPPTTTVLCSIRPDLDGDGEKDVAIVWARPLGPDDPDYRFGRRSLFRYGAVSYVADGSFHLLEDSPFLPGDGRGPSVAPLLRIPSQVIRAAEGREFVSIPVTEGSTTVLNLLLSMTADDRLHVLRTPDGDLFQLAMSDTLSYSDSYGCVSLGDREYFSVGQRFSNEADGLFEAVDVQPFELVGNVLRPLGDHFSAFRNRRSAQGRAESGVPWLPATAGLRCEGAGELGPPRPGARTAADAVRDLITAAAAKDRSIAWRRLYTRVDALNPILNPEFKGTTGTFDAYTQLTVVRDAGNWAGSAPHCVEASPEFDVRYGQTPAADCRVAPAAGASRRASTLWFKVQQRPDGQWAVSQLSTKTFS